MLFDVIDNISNNTWRPRTADRTLHPKIEADFCILYASLFLYLSLSVAMT